MRLLMFGEIRGRLGCYSAVGAVMADYFVPYGQYGITCVRLPVSTGSKA